MIDLKTVKNITISEGSVTKITNSSGVVLWQKAPSSSLDVDLNNQWVASTKTLDDYKVYMSNSNHNVNYGYASMKFKFKGQPNFKIWINSYAESNYDYTIAWDLDVNYPTGYPDYGSTGVKAHTRGKQYNPTNITAFTEVDYSNDGGEHFVVVTYRKDSSGNDNDDRGYVAIKLTLISTTWVVSKTEFVKKDGKYYQRINEVETYEGGVTSNTGNYKQGNELTVTYKQGTADDFMIVGSGKYYKKYAYVTPVNTEINTGDYIQGDLIGTITNAVYVKYLDGSAKEFTGLTSIGENTVSNKKNAKEVVICEGVTSIGAKAFNTCTNITSVTIPDSVTEIGEQAFWGCHFTELKIGNGVTTIACKAFYSCSNLKTLTIGSSVRSICAGAFNYCSKLESVTLLSANKDSIKYPNYAFEGTPSSKKLYVPSNLLSQYQQDYSWKNVFKGGIYEIGAIPAMKVTYTDSTTKYFTNLTSIESDTDPNKKNAKEVEIYDSVTSIGYQAFQDCSSLTSVTIPDSVTSIGDNALAWCSSLTGITIPNSVTSIGGYAFHSCTGLTSVTIPDSVTSIGYGAFDGCSGLTSVTIGNSVTSIGGNAFYGCAKLTSVTIPDSVKTIGDVAFEGCSGLINVTIGNGVTSIGREAFNGCEKLTSVTIPNSVTSIGNDAFGNCTVLTSVTIGNGVTSIGGWAFHSDDSHLKYITVQATTPPTLGYGAIPDEITTIYVPAASVDTYKSASDWSAFASKIKAIGS